MLEYSPNFGHYVEPDHRSDQNYAGEAAELLRTLAWAEQQPDLPAFLRHAVYCCQQQRAGCADMRSVVWFIKAWEQHGN